MNIYREGERPGSGKLERYEPQRPVDTEFSRSFETPYGHSGSDFYTCYYFLEKLLGHSDGENVIDVYQALDMTLPGILAYRAILAGGQVVDCPDFRDPAAREPYRNDNRCTDPRIASGDELLPVNSWGVPPVGAEKYRHVRQLWEESLINDDVQAKPDIDKKNKEV